MTAAALQTENRALREQVASLERENTLLRQKLDALARRLFGKKSEQLDAAQLQLLLQAANSLTAPAPTPVPVTVPAAPRRTRAHSQRLRTPEHLEVVREVIEPEMVRPKYVRRDDRALPPVIAPAPTRVADGCLAAPGLLAQLLVSKYADHLPFYRLQMMFWQRQGVFIARQQMVLWTGQCVALLEAIVMCIKQEVQHSPYVQVDETPVRYLDPERPGRCGQGYLWTGLVPGKCVLYEWHTSRAADCLDSLLGPEFKGKLQCDGYAAYPAFVKDKSEIQLFGCLAHARRGFFEAQAQAPPVVGWLLNQLGIIYGWEEQLRSSRAGPAAREARRASHNRMVMQRLERALEKLQPRYLPKSPLGQAISYALNQWPALERFLAHGEVEVDNNLVENVIQSFGLRSLCRGADNAEQPRERVGSANGYKGAWILPLGTIGTQFSPRANSMKNFLASYSSRG